MKTTFHLPEAAEALLCETIQATMLDGRVANIACKLAPDTSRERDEDEPDSVFASRSWRSVLPRVDASDAKAFRETYGWTTPEVARIIELLDDTQAELRELSPDAMLSGTRRQLLRDADRLTALRARWARAITSE